MSAGDHACIVCGTPGAGVFHSVLAQPTLIGVTWPDADAARACRRGDIDLAFCGACGLVWNVSFDPGRLDYDKNYDNSLHFSPAFRSYSEEVVAGLVDRHGLKGRTVVDVGCGKGDFLRMLCEVGGNRGYGHDPSFNGCRDEGSAAIQWSGEPFGPGQPGKGADLIASRYVLEHIPDPLGFLRVMRASSDPARTIVYCEVPDLDLIVRQHSVWDVIYEHVCYFGVESLTRIFARAGFDVIDVRETYGGQFVSVDARPAAGPTGDPGAETGDLAALAHEIERFGDIHRRRVGEWVARCAAWRAAGIGVDAWGAGAKAVCFLGMLGETAAAVRRVVDINPAKQGRFLAGTGHPIVAPGALSDDPPDIVVLMNPIYRHEIRDELASRALAPDLVSA